MIFRKKIIDFDFRLGLIVALLACGLYANTIDHEFVYDDSASITNNTLVKEGIRGIPSMLKTSYWAGYWGEQSEDAQYRPLPLIVFAVLWEFFPGNPMPGHILNVILYALTGFFLYTLLRKILSDYNIIIPFIASIIFIAHPVHTEVVANIKSADELISFLFVIFSFHFILSYAKGHDLFVKIKEDQSKKYSEAFSGYVLLLRPLLNIILSMGCFLFALMSKESPVSMLAIIPLSLYFFQNISLKKIATVALFLIIPTAIYLLIRHAVLGEISGTKYHVFIDNIMADANFSTRAATAFNILTRYLRLIIFPHPLSSDYSYSQTILTDWHNPVTVFSLLLHSGLFAFALITIKKKSIFSYGILFYMITLFLYSNIVFVIGNHFAERFLYIPLLGISIIVAALLQKININNINQVTTIKDLLKNNRPIFLLLLLFLIPWSYKTVARNANWKNESTLFASDVKNSPLSAKLHFLHGDEILQNKSNTAVNEKEKMYFLSLAIEEYNNAIRLYPKYTDAYGQRGYAYLLKGNSSKAIDDLVKSVEMNSVVESVYSNLGYLYTLAGENETAIQLYRHSVELNPRFADGWFNLASTYNNLKQYNEAIDAYLKAVKIAPYDAEINHQLGKAYQTIGDTTNAKFYLENAYRLDPSLRKQ